MNTILYGFKNSGKTTIGRCLAQKIKYSFIDTDRLIEVLYKGKMDQHEEIYSIYRKIGEESFRRYEQEVVVGLKNINQTIIAVGGGTVLSHSNVEILKSIGKLVYLNVPKEILKERILADTKTELFNQKNKEAFFEEVFWQRESTYQAIADITINSGDQAAEKIVYNLIGILNIEGKDGK